ncbi:SMI1 / KNR4 family (SUKH-1) [Paenibacillus tianmuensis]|uniref:SMI1 / KNR4 family (SUKH-1) n=1 Tax=Paenibacillus tianmuensis TaxID=624147 RepID=A0A1G4SH41_9BACL|nr:SMI1/KNR4 family protein [Paenibacillus tianmuensis]SCW68376.1 SMI1 / KNR4 family (SUKH-1) [Paenibacillus tianmuensis]
MDWKRYTKEERGAKMEKHRINEVPSLNLGVCEEMINAAAEQLGVAFPEQLKEIWKISNGLELPGSWLFYPIFDNSNPRKTSNHIVYENTKARWDYINDNLISIAAGDTGNHLVLQKTSSGLLSADVYIWNHETNKIKKWSKSLDFIKEKAHKRIDNIKSQIQRAAKRKAGS